jgi:hypothetical protein
MLSSLVDAHAAIDTKIAAATNVASPLMHMQASG